MPNWKKLVTSGGDASLNTLKLTGLSTGTPTTALMLDGSNNVEKRVLGSLAFSSDTIPTNNNQLTNGAGYTTNTGTVTSVSVGTGLDISNNTTTPSISLDLTEITLGAGLDSTATGLSLDLSELTDMTAGIDTNVDELILLDNGAERRKRFSEIFGSNAYNSTTIPTNNNQLTNGAGYTTNTGDITQVNITAGDGLTGDVNTTSGAHTQTIDVDSTVVRTSGTQTISGNKTFNGQTQFGGTADFIDPVTLDSDLTLDGISSMTESTALVMNGGNEVGYRTLGSNAFNSTSIPTAASDLNLGTSNHVQFHCLGLGQSASGTSGNLRASTIDLSGVANPQITFNGTSDSGVDIAIKATPEGLDFYEPEDGDKIHFRVLDDTGVSATYGYQVNGTTVISSGRVLQNVSGNISQFTNDSGYITSADGGNAATLDGIDSTDFYRQVDSASGTAGAGWITVAENTSGRKHSEIIVSDSESGDHSFIRIDWIRSYNDSVFTVLNCGGHANRITGVRVLSQDSNNTYGTKYLQVYVTVSSNYQVRINEVGDPGGYTPHTAHTPTVENSISGYSVHGQSMETLSTYAFATQQGIRAGGNIASNADIIAYASSDRKLKDNLIPIGNATEKLTSITGYEFDWNDKQNTFEGHDIGVVAQEVEKVLPEIVTTRDNGYKAVKYEKLTALLIQGFKEQQNQIEELKNEILILKENRIE